GVSNGTNFRHIGNPATGDRSRAAGCCLLVTTELERGETAAPHRPAPRLHYAWIVAAVSFIAIIGAAGFRAVPSVMMTPLHDEFGWSHATIGVAMSVNMVLFGVTAPFAAALMDRFGVRPILTGALLLIAAGTG